MRPNFGELRLKRLVLLPINADMTGYRHDSLSCGKSPHRSPAKVKGNLMAAGFPFLPKISIALPPEKKLTSRIAATQEDGKFIGTGSGPTYPFRWRAQHLKKCKKIAPLVNIPKSYVGSTRNRAAMTKNTERHLVP